MRRYLLILLAVCCLSTVSSGQPGAAGAAEIDSGRFRRPDAVRFSGALRSVVSLGPQDAARARRRVQQCEISARGNGDRTWALYSADRLRSQTLGHRRERLVGPVSQARRQRRRRSCPDADRRVRPGRLAGKPADVYGRRRAEKHRTPARVSSASPPKIVRPF